MVRSHFNERIIIMHARICIGNPSRKKTISSLQIIIITDYFPYSPVGSEFAMNMYEFFNQKLHTYLKNQCCYNFLRTVKDDRTNCGSNFSKTSHGSFSDELYINQDFMGKLIP